MLSNATIEILEKLDKKSLNRFVSFARSPYLNSIEILVKMAEEVSKCHPGFKSTKLSYENMWKKLYPGKTYNDKIIRNVYTKFSNLLRKFVGYQHYESKPDMVELDVILGLSENNNFKLSNKLIDAAQKETKNNFKLGADNYYFMFSLSANYFTQLDYLRHNTTDEYYKAAVVKSENFIAYALINIFGTCGEYLIMKKNYRYNKEETVIEKFLSLFNVEKFLDHLEQINHPYFHHLKIKYLIYKYTFTDITLEQFIELKKLIFANIRSFEYSEAITCIYNMQDILNTYLVPNNTGLTGELFDFAKEFCNMKIITAESRPYIELYTVRNFFTAALLAKDYEWADNFIEEYVNYIKPELRENEYNYSKAIISFKLKRYEESLDFINKFQTTDILEKMNIRLYSLMNYIELDAHESAVSMIAAIRQFTSESKEIPPAKEASLQNSLKFFSEIVKCVTNGKKMDYAVLKEALEVPKFFQKQYIVEKMESMM